MPKNKSKLPKGWLDYTNMGMQVPGTPFVPFKVPLKEKILKNKVPPNDWFSPVNVLQTEPSLKLVINLTQTYDGRYYNYKDFEEAGIEVTAIPCEGRGTLPPPRMIRRFFQIVDNFMSTSASSSERRLIGVHCTHGLNRTGLFICKYMVQRLGFLPHDAISSFETARGHRMVRQTYIDDIMGVRATRGPPAAPSSSSRAPNSNNHLSRYVSPNRRSRYQPYSNTGRTYQSDSHRTQSGNRGSYDFRRRHEEGSYPSSSQGYVPPHRRRHIRFPEYE